MTFAIHDREVVFCQHCQKEAAQPRVVDSLIGLAAWNMLHPEDPRTQMVFCSGLCILAFGLELGREVRRRKGWL
jgi:hypothetical protein